MATTRKGPPRSSTNMKGRVAAANINKGAPSGHHVGAGERAMRKADAKAKRSGTPIGGKAKGAGVKGGGRVSRDRRGRFSG